MQVTSGLMVALTLALGVQDAPVVGLKGDELKEARALIERMAARLEGVERLVADYEQEQSSLLLEEPLISRGRLHLRSKPGCLVLELQEPRPVVIRSDATSHQIYYPGKKRAERYLFEKNEVTVALLSCFTANVGNIEKSFTLMSVDEGKENIRLGLQPRDKKVRVTLDFMLLEVRKKDAALVGVTYQNADAEEVVLRLSKLKLDPVVKEKPEIFDRPLPDGVQLVVQRVKAPRVDR